MFNSLFILLLLLSLGCLIVGLVKPNVFRRIFKREMTRKKTSLIFGISSIVLFVLVGMTSPSVTRLPNCWTGKTQRIPQNFQTRDDQKKDVVNFWNIFD